MNFADYDFSSRLKDQLDAMEKSRRMPHAVIVTGGTEETRQSLASFLSMYCVCTSKERPCGVCSQCLKAKSKNHIDIYFAKGKGKTDGIMVESVDAGYQRLDRGKKVGGRGRLDDFNRIVFERMFVPESGFLDGDVLLVEHIDFAVGGDKERFVDAVEHEHIVAAALRLDGERIAFERIERKFVADNIVVVETQVEILEVETAVEESRKIRHPFPPGGVGKHIDGNRYTVVGA